MARRPRSIPAPTPEIPGNPDPPPNWGLGADVSGGYTGPPPTAPMPDWPIAPDMPPVDIEMPPDLQGMQGVPMDGGGMSFQHPDGSVTLDFSPGSEDRPEIPFDGNLATVLDDLTLGKISSQLISGIEDDDNSRQVWMQNQAKAIDLLGLKVEDPRTSAVSAPVEGMSVVRHPLMLEAVQRFHANAMSELLPSAGPVKVMESGVETGKTSEQAKTLEKQFNYFLTEIATEFYPDTDRMLFRVGLSGMGFKKVYRCPLRRRPVSESINASDLIVSDHATDIANASRVTHRIDMRHSVMKRMQLAGVYRDIDLGQPAADQPDAVRQKIASTQGINTSSQRPEDQPYEVLECYCELDIEGFEHVDENGEPTGLPLPYRVTIEKTSQKILDIRRNWKEGDPDCIKRINIVPFIFEPGLGFWGIGFINILGNMTAAATAAIRVMLDAGMFSNFPGGIVDKRLLRQLDNNLRPGPGEFKPVNAEGFSKLSDGMSVLPYKDPSAAFQQFISYLVETGRRVGQTQDIQVGEGRQDAPVGTTLALLDQSTKVMGAVHKRLHQAQKREFQMLLELFREDPESLWRKSPQAVEDFNLPALYAALENISIVPCSDPNTPSRIHRLAKVQAFIALAQQAAQAQVPINPIEVYTWAAKEMDIADPERFLMQPQQMPQQQQNPALMMQAQEVQNKGHELQIKAMDTQYKYQDREADRQSKEKLQVLKLAETLAVHPGADAVVDEQITQLAPMVNGGHSIPPQYPQQPGVMPPQQPQMPQQSGMQPPVAPPRQQLSPAAIQSIVQGIQAQRNGGRLN